MSAVIDPDDGSTLVNATQVESPIPDAVKANAREHVVFGVFASLIVLMMLAWFALLAYGAWWVYDSLP